MLISIVGREVAERILMIENGHPLHE
jgi:hypothetical protein